MELKGTTAIVTGAGSGLGQATAKYLKELGMDLVLVDLNKASVDEVATDLQALSFAADVSSDTDISNVFTGLANQNKIPRVCVNCAGIVLAMKMFGRKGQMDVNTFRKVIDINLIGTYNIMFHTIKHMLELKPVGVDGERGVLINTSSVAAFEGQIGQVAYSASKGAVASITLPAARELAPSGIRVNTIAPGLMDTPMLAGLPEAAKESLISTTHFPKRLGHGSEFAMLVEQIIKNPLINGETIRLDGAVRLAAK